MDRKSKGLVVLYLLNIVASLYSGNFEFTIDDTRLRRGEKLIIRVLVPHDVIEEVEVLTPPAKEGLRYWSRPYKHRKPIPNEEGKIEYHVYIRIESDELMPGIYALDPFEFTINSTGERWKTEPREIVVLERDEAHLNYPISVKWRIPEGTFFESQSIPISLIMEGVQEVSFPDSISVTAPRSSVFQEIAAVEEIEKQEVGLGNIYNIPVATYLLSPTRSGQLILERGRINAYGISRRTKRHILYIEPLPSAVKSSRSVGDFQWEIAPLWENVGINSEFKLEIILKGAGNFYELMAPIINTDLDFLGTEDSIEVIPSPVGYSGSRRWIYSYIASESGAYDIEIESYPFLDPVTGDVNYLKGDTLKALVSPQIDSQELKGPQQSLIPFEELSSYWGSSFYRNPFQHLWILPGLFAFFLLILLKKRSGPLIYMLVLSGLFVSSTTAKSIPQEAQKAYELWALQDFQAAGKQFAEVASMLDQRNYGLSYNAGIAYLKAGEEDMGIYYLRSALRGKPMNTLFRTTLAGWQEYLDLEDAILPSFPVHSDVFYLTLIVCLNLLMISLGLFFRYKKGNSLFIALFWIICSVGSSFGLFGSLYIKNKPQGVLLTSEVSLRKVPHEKASGWLSLPGGTSVYLRGTSEDFYLIKTGYGLEGWIHQRDIKMME